MSEWKDIPFWEGYIANENGEIARKSDGLILKIYSQRSGYCTVYLNRGNGTVAIPVHRLICCTFHGTEGYKEGLFVDHIDTDRSNNKAENLRWVTPKENANNELTLKKKRRKER